MFKSLFNRLIRSLLTEGFDKLPPKPPYGFWITPSGDFIPVFSNQGHEDIAVEIVIKSPKLAKYAYEEKLNGQGSYEEYIQNNPNGNKTIGEVLFKRNEAAEVLLMHKYGRVVKSRNNNTYFLNVFDVFANDPAIKKVEATAKDIADFYDYDFTYVKRGFGPSNFR